jgi:hypothetical protein
MGFFTPLISILFVVNPLFMKITSYSNTKIYRNNYFDNAEDYIKDYELYNKTISYYKSETNNKKNNDCALIPIKDISPNHEKIKQKLKEYLENKNIKNN